MALAASVELAMSGTLTNPLDLSAPIDSVAVGEGEFPAAAFDLDDGNGDLQAQSWWHDLRALAAGATDSIDLAGSLTGPFGVTVTALKIKAILAVIKDPANTKYLRVGPQGVANAAQLGFGGVAAAEYVEFDTFCFLPKVYTGWTITAGSADLLPIKNPSAVSIDSRCI